MSIVDVVLEKKNIIFIVFLCWTNQRAAHTTLWVTQLRWRSERSRNRQTIRQSFINRRKISYIENSVHFEEINWPANKTKMELPHLGTHCELESCKRLDYLPVTCEYCKGVFCTQHGYSADSHGCPNKHLIKDLKVILIIIIILILIIIYEGWSLSQMQKTKSSKSSLWVEKETKMLCRELQIENFAST